MTTIDNDWIGELVVNGYLDDNEGLSFEEYIKANWVNYYPDLDNVGWDSLTESECIELENKTVQKIMSIFPWY